MCCCDKRNLKIICVSENNHVEQYYICDACKLYYQEHIKRIYGKTDASRQKKLNTFKFNNHNYIITRVVSKTEKHSSENELKYYLEVGYIDISNPLKNI